MRPAFRIALCSLVLLANGCSRTRYRMAADRDSYRVLNEKVVCANKALPPGYSVQPDPRARFYDPTNPDCPELPVPRPVLYGYQLPELMSGRGPANNVVAATPPAAAPTAQPPAEPVPTPAPVEVQPPPPPPAPESALPTPVPTNLPSVAPVEQEVVPAGFLIQPAEFGSEAELRKQPGELTSPIGSPAVVQTTADENSDPAARAPRLDESNSKSGEAGREATGPSPAAVPSRPFAVGTQRKVTIPEKAWTVLPEICLNRMFEFESLRAEYAQSFPQTALDGSRQSDTQRLTLANLMELAVINSREYQTRKEILYRTALAVTRQRYQFDLNPTPFGNGTAANYRHLRDGGVEVNRLSIPSGVGVQQTLASGGEFLARFANSVVLTFNGPSGFAADVGSEMVFDFQQTVFQRDIRFENLTQAERDVIYAVRDYLRFRKQLFRDIANQYYNLLVNFRGIEINAQDYFTNLRGFLQSQAEYRTAEKIPRIQVDQFEQNVLRSRSNLVNNVFALEAALDQMKLRIGLPTEMVVQLDLTELQSISLKDELSVARQMIQRTRLELTTARESRVGDATSLANVAEVLTDRMVNILAVQKRMQAADPEFLKLQAEGAANQDDPLTKASLELEEQQQTLQILGARMQVDALRAEFDSQINADLPVPPLRILIRAIEFASAEMTVIDLALSSKRFAQSSLTDSKLQERRDELVRRLGELTEFLDRISTKIVLDVAAQSADEFSQIPDKMKESVEMVKAVDKLAKEVTRDILPADGKSVEAKVQQAVDKAIELSDRLLMNGPDGWTDIQLDQNEAMLTGLVQRLDLMNQRGDLADAWRQIKLAGDDLRSIVDLRATQILRTKSGDNDPFNFTFDDSETRLSVALDTPLNRRLQRNNFRVALINYNVGLRNLLAAEDGIKLDVREDLRQLALDRNQYGIAVASAALAFERVISTRLRLQLSVQNVAARDFLESQQAYTNALNSIARLHINYITDRLELFFDLEAFDVDQLGYWDGVGQDDAPQVNVDFPGSNPRPYDCLPGRVWYSPTIRHMEHIPPGESVIMQP